jgi:hypothetical protein
MGFDTQRFMGDDLALPQSTVRVSALRAWFSEGESPEWTVRALTAAEYARCREAVEAHSENGLDAVLAALGGAQRTAGLTGLFRALKATAGSEELTGDLVRRIHMLRIASVDPEIDHDAAVRLSELAAETFYLLTNEIFRLTGRGPVPKGESNASGETTG